MWFIKWCVVACGVFVLAIVAAVLVGRSQPTPAILAALKLDKCELPCWIGITPGLTTGGEAWRFVRETYFNDPRYTVHVDLSWNTISVELNGTSEKFEIYIDTYRTYNEDTALVKQIWLRLDSLNEDTPAAGDIVWRGLGRPQELRLSNRFFMYHPDIRFTGKKVEVHVLGSTACDAISFHQTLAALVLYDELDGSWSSDPAPWRGFDHCHDLKRYPVPE